jgi:branched-chain amino acid transport system substrate-binding protein
MHRSFPSSLALILVLALMTACGSRTPATPTAAPAATVAPAATEAPTVVAATAAPAPTAVAATAAAVPTAATLTQVSPLPQVSPLSEVSPLGGTTAPSGSAKLGDWASPAPTKLTASVTLGFVLGLTQDIAVYGQSQKNGVQLAVDQINAGGYLGNSKLVAAIENSTGTNEGAIAAMTKAIDDDKAVGVVGPTLSAQAFAADPIAQEKGIPVIGPSNTVAGIVEMGNFIFRDSLPESAVIPGTVKEVVSLLGVKKVGILWGNNDDFSVGGYKVFKQALQDNNVQIVDDETFARGDVDFQAQLTKIIAQKPDAIVASALAKEGALIITQARSLGFTGLIVGGNGFNSPAVIKGTGPAGEGLIVGAAWNIASAEPLSQDFIKTYQAAFNAPPDQFAVQAYTAVWLFATAIRRADSVDPKTVRDTLAGIQNFATPLGNFSFGTDRNPNHPPVAQIVRGGKFVVLTAENAKQ